MHSEVNILLGVSGGEAVRFLSLLTENDQIRYHCERAETKRLFQQKATKGQYDLYIVSLDFLTNNFPDFTAQYPGTATILLCNASDFEAAIPYLRNGISDCLLLDSLTAEKIVSSIRTTILAGEAKLAQTQANLSAIERSGTAQMQAKQELQKFYERFIRISSTTNDGVWEWNLTDNSLWANENHQLLYGLTAADPVPNKQEWVDRIHPDDRQRLLDMQDHALASDTNVFISEYRFRTGDSYKYIFDRCYIERDNNGTPVLMTGSMMDVTERKIAEEKIVHSNERFELIARTTNEALWEMDLVTGYTWSNEIHQQLYGLTLEDEAPMFQLWEDNILETERAAVLKSFYDVFNSNENVWISEYRMYNHKKEIIAIYDRTYIVRNNEGKPIRMTGSMMDITERKKASEALIKSEEKYRTLVDQATDAIFIADQTGRFVVVNPAAVKLSQYSEKELMEMTIYHLTDPEEVKLKPFAFEEMKSERGASSERRMRRKDGVFIDIEINAKFLSDGRFLAFIRDITERKKAETELNNSYKAIRKLTSHLQNAREEERKHIARNIHDELGQLLTVLKMDISWLGKKIKALNIPAITEKTEGVLELLNNTVQSVRRIAADLRPGLLDDLGLVAAIEWHLSEFGKRTGIHTHFATSDVQTILPVEHATSLFRIYQESMTNIARHAEATEITVELTEESKKIILRVSDNGKGFDTSIVVKRKTLGLLGMKERAEMMGGQFTLTKQINGGMQIEVQLPLHKSEPIEALQP
ncbi:PAS domain S-box-containing protein [Lacibacter cauensis]|uniref:PAS domain S-box-containing protein n=1 Tax=Lacibacter cauensis TaxID=510947 RepID=A0A562SJV2_9BACT|nr:PAS domain S-box protein [Lacibacter cauensis]TWI81116.1 PAS domain S-box-containing protein [Lacibacter cauensis]